MLIGVDVSMVNRMYQSLVHQMKNAMGRNCGVTDSDGIVIACSELSMNGSDLSSALSGHAADDAFTAGGYSFRLFPSTSPMNNYSFVEGVDEVAASSAAMLAVSLDELKQYFDEKFDIVNFIKNLLYDNILPGEIYAKCKDMSIEFDIPRSLLLVRTSNDSDIPANEILSTFFPNKTNDFVVSVNDTDTVIVFENPENSIDINKLSSTIMDTFSTEYYSQCYIGIGSTAKNIKDIGKSYKEAQLALEVGRVFDNKKHIISYENLGIGRLIFQLPKTLCDMFINEVFKEGSINMLDTETLLTIQKFFENNLNVSETARKLFVHRNTLVYRLEKIKKITGLDIREFDNAITFKVAIMVNQYLSSNDNNLL